MRRVNAYAKSLANVRRWEEPALILPTNGCYGLEAEVRAAEAEVRDHSAKMFGNTMLLCGLDNLLHLLHKGEH